MTPEQQQSIVKTLQAALTTVEEKWNDKTESQAWMVGYLEGTIKRLAIYVVALHKFNKLV